MKKRISQRLVLSKETLRNLSDRDLQAAVGGATLGPCGSNPCFTEADTCTNSGCPSHWSDCCTTFQTGC